MATVTSKCPHCGAQIVFEEKSKITICQYCESIIAIREISDKVNGHNIDKYETHELSPQYEIVASYLNSINSAEPIFGYLLITEDEIFFKPNKLINLTLKSLDEMYISYENIRGYKIYNKIQGLLYLEIDGKLQTRIFATVLGKDCGTLLNNIEYNRKQYYKKHGLDVKELSNESIQVSGHALRDFSKFSNVWKYVCKSSEVIIIVSALFFVIVILITLFISL